MSAIWAVGDLQGCCQALEQLLAHPAIAADPDARFWFAGDLVNRGPCSLATLRRVISLGERAVCVLGNHDLHLLAAAAGARAPRAGDTLDDILRAPDAAALIDWLRQRPLAHAEGEHLLVHAGIQPGWTRRQTLERAAEVEAVLRGPSWRTFMTEMYGNEPAAWRDDLQGNDRLRLIVNTLTRMRFCDASGRLDFIGKENAAHPPAGYLPWFDVTGRKTADTTVVFGHWSTLGLVLRGNLLALDTGCIWGGRLTAVRLQDRMVVQIDCADLPGVRQPG